MSRLDGALQSGQVGCCEYVSQEVYSKLIAMILDGSFQGLNACLFWEWVRHERLSIHPVIHQVCMMEMLNSSVTAGVILNAVSWSILAEISSCPLAFVVSSVESRLYTSSSVQRKLVGQLSGEV